MLIFEIINTNIKKSYDAGVFDVDRHAHIDHDGGFTAHVVPTRDPHLIKRKTHYPSYFNNDPYYAYIQYIVNNKVASSNPYAPRIYDINVSIDKNNRAHYDIEMEKLYHLTVISQPELDVLYNKITGAFVKNIRLNNMTDSLRRYVMTRSYNASLDKNFIKISEIINKINNEINGSEIDLHGANMMARRTPHGYQLVITDPLSEIE